MHLDQQYLFDFTPFVLLLWFQKNDHEYLRKHVFSYNVVCYNHQFLGKFFET